MHLERVGKNSGTLSLGDCLGRKGVPLALTENRNTHPGRLVCSAATALTALSRLVRKVALLEDSFLDKLSDHGLIKRLKNGAV